MLFTYWTHSAIPQPPSAKAWRDLYPDFRVFSDRDVLEIIETEDERNLYNSIRLPAAKSDLARLLLLKQHGGLYVDAHTGPAKPENLVVTLEALSAYEILLFGKKWQVKLPTDFNLMNTVIAARKNSTLLSIIIKKLYCNLFQQREREYEQGLYVAYGLHSLTGTGVFVQTFFETSSPPPHLKAKYKDQIYIIMLENNSSHGFNIYQFYGYREPGQHWSERQKSERLFEHNNSSTTSLLSSIS